MINRIEKRRRRIHNISQPRYFTGSQPISNRVADSAESAMRVVSITDKGEKRLRNLNVIKENNNNKKKVTAECCIYTVQQ